MKKVYVGMSGGVDSSVTAALIKNQGYDVTGVYMKNWAKDLPGYLCPWREDLADAKTVAAQLEIPLKVFDFQDEYWDNVVQYMIDEYKAGRTPNPDMMCNQEIKFKLFLDAALNDGADMIATGHYARTDNGQLFTGKDSSKDQSYFLGRVTEEALEKTIFPLGEITKDEVRQKAEELGLATADKPDSQGICFIGEIDIKDFLANYIDEHQGDIILKRTGEVVGQHDGAEFYTIGQRHGLGVGGGTPYYVIGKDIEKNIIYVTDDPESLALHTDTFTVGDIHWINEKPETDEGINVQTRYRAEHIPCKIEFEDSDTMTVNMQKKERAISPGQSAVFYDGERVLGAAIIR